MIKRDDGLLELYKWMRAQEAGDTLSASELPKNHYCYGCGNYGGICVDLCTKELFADLKKIQDRRNNHE